MVATLPSEPEVLNFACHHCHAVLTVPAALAGVTGPCPCCGHTISAPEVRSMGLTESERPHPTVMPPTAPAPAPLRRTAAADQAAQEQAYDESAQPTAGSSGLRGIHIGLFEKRGFRPVRMALAVASSVAIFMSFYVLKSRRWVWEPAPDGMAGNSGPTKSAPASRKSTPGADSTNLRIAPAAANLQARTDTAQ